MSRSGYEPQPGTIAYRALAHLQNEPGCEVTMSVWAEGIGVQANGMDACVEPLLRHGLVQKFNRHGQTRPAWYRLPRVAEPVGLHVEAGIAPKGAETPQQGANRDASAGQSHGADGSARPNGRGANGASARGAAPVSNAPAPRCALWSDGTLVIERPSGEVLRFDADEATTIVRYLRRAWLEVAT